MYYVVGGDTTTDTLFFIWIRGTQLKSGEAWHQSYQKKKKQRKAKKKKKNSNFVSTVYCGYEKNLHYLTSF
jgi:hypothetical protein